MPDSVLMYLIPRKGLEKNLLAKYGFDSLVTDRAVVESVSFLRRFLVRIHQSLGGVRVTQDAFCEVARLFDVDMMTLVLDVARDDIFDLGSVLEAASRNINNGEGITRLLLERIPNDQISDATLTRVAASCSGNVMAWMLARIDTSASGVSNSMMMMKMMDVAAGNVHGDATLKLVFDIQGETGLITTSMIEKAAGSPYTEKNPRCIAERVGYEAVKISVRAMEAALNHRKSGRVLGFIISHWGGCGSLPITEAVVSAAVRNEYPTGLAVLIQHCKDGLPLTEKILLAAAKSNDKHLDGEHILSVLLDLPRADVSISETVLQAVATIDDMAQQRRILDKILERDGMRPSLRSALKATDFGFIQACMLDDGEVRPVHTSLKRRTFTEDMLTRGDERGDGDWQPNL